MSMKPGSRSAPEIASASAELYQVSATMPGAKSENTNVAPAEPSTFGPSGLNCAPTKTGWRSEEHTSELQSLMRNSYAVFCLKKKKKEIQNHQVQKTSRQ